MDYEKKYKDALANARQEYNTTEDVERKQWLEELFHELAESEDEKIRKALVRFHKSTIDIDGIKGADILAWLEKQKDTNALIQEASEKAYIEGLRVERKHWLEKQRESTLKSTLIEEIKRRKELLLSEKEKALSISENLSLGGRIAMLEELLVFVNEKQGEQKPSNVDYYHVDDEVGNPNDWVITTSHDKVEPKFKVGDKVYNIKNGLECTIESIDEMCYYCDMTNFDIKDQDGWKLVEQKPKNPADNVEPIFSIGDVLCDKSCTTLNKNSQPNIEILDIRDGMYICNNCTFPIEQQDEYELVAKEIEQKPVWSDEDDYNLQHCCMAISADDLHTYEDKQEMEAWLKSLKDRIGG